MRFSRRTRRSRAATFTGIAALIIWVCSSCVFCQKDFSRIDSTAIKEDPDTINADDSGLLVQVNAVEWSEIDWADVPIVGIRNQHRVCQHSETLETDWEIGCSAGVTVASAPEKDAILTVGNVETGELMCEGLVDAAEEEVLKFALTSTQSVRARRKSAVTLPGHIFADGMSRQVWTGVVIEKTDFVGIPRSISMTWSDCNVEAFFVEMSIPLAGGGTSSLLSMPCTSNVGTTEICMMEVSRAPGDELDGAAVDSAGIAPTVSADPSQPLSFGDLSYTDSRFKPSFGGMSSRSVYPSPPGSTYDSDAGFSSPADYSDGYYTQAEGEGRRLKEMRMCRQLEVEVAEGIDASRAVDPDLDAKDEDIHLLQEYLSADSEGEKEAFHNQGLRRISPQEVKMPSGRVLATTNVVDVLVLYTEAAVRAVNGPGGEDVRPQSQMETVLAAAYATANDAFVDSGIDVTLNVVHMELIPYEEQDEIDEVIRDLYQGRGQGEGVPVLRNRYGADLVQLVGFFADTCGVGFAMEKASSAFAPYAYSVVHTNCLTHFSHTRELGHNMGAHQDQQYSEASNAFAYGYQNCVGNMPYRTIMTDDAGCRAAPRVNIFSNPYVAFHGADQGTSPANNARAIQESLVVVSNFRGPVVSASHRTSAVSRLSKKGVAPMIAPAEVPPESSQVKSPLIVREKEAGGESIYPERLSTKLMKLKGCFRDGTSYRVMAAGVDIPAIEGKTVGMTRNTCMTYCVNERLHTSRPYTHFGVRNGMECFCGENDSKSFKRLGRVNSNECDVPCAGEATESCGGVYAIEVFAIKKFEGWR